MGKILIIKDADFSNVSIDVVNIYTWEQGGWSGVDGPNTDTNRIRLKEESYLVWQNDKEHFVSCASGYKIAVFNSLTGVIVSDKTGFVQSSYFMAEANKKYVVTCRKDDNTNIIPEEGASVKLVVI